MMITTEIMLINDAIVNGGDKIMKQDDRVLKLFITEQIQVLFVLAGQTPGKNDVKSLRIEITKDLQTRYKTMTLKEVGHCFASGIRGEYGDYYGINVATINKWLRTYYNSDERKEAMRRIVLPETTTTLLLPEYKISTEEIVIKRWERFKIQGFVRDMRNTAYNYLDSKKLIPFTVQEKNEMMRKAKIELKNEAKDNANMLQVGAMLDRIENQENQENQEKINEIIKQRAKRIALNAFFARLVNEKKDLTELL
jgi:hypothetical protein